MANKMEIQYRWFRRIGRHLFLTVVVVIFKNGHRQMLYVLVHANLGIFVTEAFVARSIGIMSMASLHPGYVSGFSFRSAFIGTLAAVHPCFNSLEKLC